VGSNDGQWGSGDDPVGDGGVKAEKGSGTAVQGDRADQWEDNFGATGTAVSGRRSVGGQLWGSGDGGRSSGGWSSGGWCKGRGSTAVQGVERAGQWEAKLWGSGVDH
jgi:hypothetical protein